MIDSRGLNEIHKKGKAHFMMDIKNIFAGSGAAVNGGSVLPSRSAPIAR